MTRVEILWEELKATARDYALRGIRPSAPQAERVVHELVWRGHLSPAPPDDIIEMYAHELLEMISQFGTETRA